MNCNLFFLIGNNFGSLEDSSTIEYTEDQLVYMVRYYNGSVVPHRILPQIIPHRIGVHNTVPFSHTVDLEHNIACHLEHNIVCYLEHNIVCYAGHYMLLSVSYGTYSNVDPHQILPDNFSPHHTGSCMVPHIPYSRSRAHYSMPSRIFYFK